MSRSSQAATGGARLAWLDLLRGFAALVVTLHHASFYFVPQARSRLVILGWFDPGIYGVLLFFLVSGYIIPASLERHGRVRRFWIGRLFRIYPMLTVACVIALLPVLFGVREPRAGLGGYDPLTAALAHMTMLQDVLAVPNVINVLWTLSYEMLFYLLVVALFVTGTHRWSAPIAVTLTVAAVALGGVLPTVALSRAAGVGPVVTLTAVVLPAAIAAAIAGNPVLRMVGGITGGVLALTLAALNGRVGAWQSLVILAVMFTGTVLYRAEHGQIGRRTAAVAATLVLAGAVVAGVAYAETNVPPAQVRAYQIYWAGSVLLAAVTFGVVAVLRHRRIPRWASGLGKISFSVYLLHHVLLMLNDQFGGTPDHDAPVRLAIFLVVVIAMSTLTYRYIELPFQRMGHRLGRSAAPRPAPLVPPVPPDAAVGRADAV